MALRLKYPPKYILDEMEWYEVKAVLDYQHYAYKDVWEANRLTSFVVSKMLGSKIETPNDLMPFYWEEEDTDEKETASKEQMEELRRRAKEIEDNLNKKTN